MNVLLIGNPNVGKTSLFNHLTGSRAHVGNYPGVTVERRCAERRIAGPNGGEIRLDIADAPGAYSLSARSREEQISLQAVLGQGGVPRPDVVVAVVNAGQLSRNLYLVTQLLELRVRVVVALNMMDEAGDEAPDPKRLALKLGVPCVATNGDTGTGVDELLSELALLLDPKQEQYPQLHPRFAAEVISAADRISHCLPSEWRGSVERDRALSLWALASIEEDDELIEIPLHLRKCIREIRASGTDYDFLVANARYQAIDELLAELGTKDATHVFRLSEKVDRILLHPFLGFVAFLLTMLLVFQALFSWSDPFIGVIEDLVGALQVGIGNALPKGILRDLLTEGVIGGVGNVIVFLPQILLLFLFIGLLEDSGYMARVAYLMDRIMKSLGLHGRAFVPMLSGFACAIPAIMATRTLESRRDRLLTMMVVPLMTCSARLPVYTLLTAALFPPTTDSGLPVQGLLMIALYLFSVLVALLAAWVLGRTVMPGRPIPLILELPPYRLPRLLPIFRMMRLRAGQFLTEAGTVILAATIVLWTLLSFPRASSEGQTLVDGKAVVTFGEAPALEDSYAGRLGKVLEPAVRPLGFDWKIATGIVGAFAAREVFVSTMALVYGIGEVDDEALPLRERIRNEKTRDGQPAYTPLVGLSLMIFFALACQCMSTLAVVKRETRSWRWPGFLFVYMTALAYFFSLIVYQGGRLLGF
jgi:ferrous iron transport protein B